MAVQTIDKDLEEILAFFAGFIKKLIERLGDGFQPVQDTLALLPALMGGQEAFEGNENAWKYLAPLDDQKLDETTASIMAKINEVNPLIQAIVKPVLKTLGNGYMSYLAIKAYQESKRNAAPAQPQG